MCQVNARIYSWHPVWSVHGSSKPVCDFLKCLRVGTLLCSLIMALVISFGPIHTLREPLAFWEYDRELTQCIGSTCGVLITFDHHFFQLSSISSLTPVGSCISHAALGIHLDLPLLNILWGIHQSCQKNVLEGLYTYEWMMVLKLVPRRGSAMTKYSNVPAPSGWGIACTELMVLFIVSKMVTVLCYFSKSNCVLATCDTVISLLVSTKKNELVWTYGSCSMQLR